MAHSVASPCHSVGTGPVLKVRRIEALHPRNFTQSSSPSYATEPPLHDDFLINALIDVLAEDLLASDCPLVLKAD